VLIADLREARRFGYPTDPAARDVASIHASEPNRALQPAKAPIRVSSLRPAGLRRNRSGGLSSPHRTHRRKLGNLKAVQKLLGHASIQTTGDIYADWDIEQLNETLRQLLETGE